SESDWIISNQLRKRAKTYFDWVMPALVRHESNKVLHGDENGVVVSNENLKQDESSWQIEVLEGNKLTNLTEDAEVSKTDLREMIIQWQGVSDDLLAEEQ